MKISEERIKWVLRDYEGVLKYCDARYANYRRSYICEKQELQNFVLPETYIHRHGGTALLAVYGNLYQ